MFGTRFYRHVRSCSTGMVSRSCFSGSAPVPSSMVSIPSPAKSMELTVRVESPLRYLGNITNNELKRNMAVSSMNTEHPCQICDGGFAAVWAATFAAVDPALQTVVMKDMAAGNGAHRLQAHQPL